MLTNTFSMGPSALNAYFNPFLKVVGHNINLKVLGGEGSKEIRQTSGFFLDFYAFAYIVRNVARDCKGCPVSLCHVTFMNVTKDC